MFPNKILFKLKSSMISGLNIRCQVYLLPLYKTFQLSSYRKWTSDFQQQEKLHEGSPGSFCRNQNSQVHKEGMPP